MPTSTVNAVLTAEQYSKLPDVPGYRDELIDGERTWSPLPKAAHSAVIKRLEQILEAQRDTLSDVAVAVIRESGLYIRAGGMESVPGPDLMVLSERAYRKSIREGGWFEGILVFVVEVVSPSERKSQRLHKVGLYLEAGIAFVVEVDYTKRVFIVHSHNETATVYTNSIDKPFQAQLADVFGVLD